MRDSIFSGRVYDISQGVVGPIAYVVCQVAIGCGKFLDGAPVLHATFWPFATYTVVTAFSAGPILASSEVRKPALLHHARRLAAWIYILLSWSMSGAIGVFLGVVGVWIGVCMLYKARHLLNLHISIGREAGS